MEETTETTKADAQGGSRLQAVVRAFEGQRVTDAEGNRGTVNDASDIHNVLVMYDDGGQGLYCLDTECDHNEALYGL